MATCSLHNLLNASLLSESGPPLLDFEVKYGYDFTVVKIKILGFKFVVPCIFDIILEPFMLSDKFGLHFLISWLPTELWFVCFPVISLLLSIEAKSLLQVLVFKYSLRPCCYKYVMGIVYC